MPTNKKSFKGQVPQTLKKKQLFQRLIGTHEDSEIWITGRDPFGFPVKVAVRGVRITMNDAGKCDLVELVS